MQPYNQPVIEGLVGSFDALFAEQGYRVYARALQRTGQRETAVAITRDVFAGLQAAAHAGLRLDSIADIQRAIDRLCEHFLAVQEDLSSIYRQLQQNPSPDLPLDLGAIFPECRPASKVVNEPEPIAPPPAAPPRTVADLEEEKAPFVPNWSSFETKEEFPQPIEDNEPYEEESDWEAEEFPAFSGMQPLAHAAQTQEISYTPEPQTPSPGMPEEQFDARFTAPIPSPVQEMPVAPAPKPPVAAQRPLDEELLDEHLENPFPMRAHTPIPGQEARQKPLEGFGHENEETETPDAAKKAKFRPIVWVRSLLLILFLILLIWVFLGFAMGNGWLPVVDLGYSWFNQTIFPVF